MDRRPLQDDSEDMRSVPRLVSGIQSLSSIREGEARRCIPISSWQRKTGETRELGGVPREGAQTSSPKLSSRFSFSGSCVFHVGPLTVSAHCVVSSICWRVFQELVPCSSCGGHYGLVGTICWLESMHDRVRQVRRPGVQCSHALTRKLKCTETQTFLQFRTDPIGETRAMHPLRSR